MADLILWKDKELRQLRNEMDEMIKDFFRDFGTSVFEEVRGEAMLMDMVEKNSSVVVTIQLPGVEADDLDLAVSPESLVLTGTRTEVLDRKGSRFERSRKFSNSIKLPCRIEPDQVRASYQDNILEIVLPKCRASVFRKVKISQPLK